uniref:Uncharacterized protein n=1 Tax=Anguilla anguilla TaxID=7936 RepID=A0A0E9VPL3_ANGAN
MVTTPMLWIAVSKNENNPSEMSTVANDALKCVQRHNRGSKQGCFLLFF